MSCGINFRSIQMHENNAIITQALNKLMDSEYVMLSLNENVKPGSKHYEKVLSLNVTNVID